MKITVDKNYGCTIDGNRGRLMTEYELEHTEEELQEIAEILYADGYTHECTGNTEIEYEGILIDVCCSDYKDEIYQLEKDNGDLDDIPDLESDLEKAERIKDMRDDVGDQIHEEKKDRRANR